MLLRNLVLTALSVVAFIQAKAQLFETRCTRYAKVNILDSLRISNHRVQIELRDSIMETLSASLAAGDTIETYFDGEHLGLVIYRDRKPHELIGFWDPDGNPVNGGVLADGNGTILTPFNPTIVANFDSESVVYEAGLKNGPVFYYCDCASVLREGTFNNNQKEGLWKEFTPDGEFIQEKEMVIEPVEIKEVPDDIKWIEPAHCMMRNPNEDIICPGG